MKKTLLVIILIMMLGVSCVAFVSCKKTDVAYTVLQITDAHILNSDKDKSTFDTIDMLIDNAKPDLIVVTGDITSEHDNLTAIKKFGSFIEGYKIPWTFTFGNHDAEGAIGKQEINDYLLSLKYCVYERGDESVDGFGYHYINVKSNKKVVASLLMMDSNMYNADLTIGGYDKFHENQIDWYERTIKAIAKEVNGSETKVVPSLAFFHIPMIEYIDAYKIANKNKSVLYGEKLEEPCPSKSKDLMFEKMLELGSTKGVFVGHDHMNNYAMDYKGIRLSYGITSDHNIYFAPMRGGTIIKIKKDGSFTQQGVYRQLGKGELRFTVEV